jgi:hypothetical protein
MSSKPLVGINHKEYGVTSEGVNMYLDVGLRKVLAIDPKESDFSIKMTGNVFEYHWKFIYSCMKCLITKSHA